jgi:small subunit ribosomal protein S12
MPTFHQSIKQPRSKVKIPSKSPASQKSPQKKGVCLRVYIRSPKKPNPAKRKVTNLLLSGKARSKVIGYTPGEGHTLQEHPIVPIRGGRVKDLPGVKYHLIPGLSDSKNVKKRKQKRSKYGVKSTNK